MIKVGIAGADNPVAGEILRLCLHHPDVEIISAYAPSYSGRSVSEVHRGFIGEPRLLFSSNFDATALDVAFLMQPVYSDSDWAKLMTDRQQLHLVLFPGTESLADGLSRTPIYGLSEMNRKPLVRGAREAVVPSPLAVPALIALNPLARHLLLPESVNIKVSGPADVIEAVNVAKARQEVRRELMTAQTSFSGNVAYEAIPSDSSRSMKMEIDLPISVSTEEILKIYDSIYDDHNFTHVITAPVTPEDVESTNRVIISVGRSDNDGIRLTVVADPRMRGGAGEAIHIMNLFLGLHEKTGLDLHSTAGFK